MGGYSVVSVGGLLFVVASLVAEHGLLGAGALVVAAMDSVVVAHELSCPMAYGIFPDQSLKSCPQHCKVDS